MREALFIKKNKDEWLKAQHMPADDADEMATEFTRLVDDLSYAKTFYPHSKVTQYLNTRASKTYMSIYQNRKEERNRIIEFWKVTAPMTIRKHHGVLLFCTILFITFFAVGFYSSGHDESFVREMLGNSYVNMTEENIEKGQPFGVYAEGSSLMMWLGIMINNLMVAFGYFLKGLFLCFPVLYALVNEAIRLGAFEQMFFAKGLGLHSVLTVFIHGTLEISAIVIAAAAGVIIGKSWVFPGKAKRMDAFMRGAKDGVIILATLIPVFVVAAFFEGFVTRYYTMPMYVSGLFLAISAGYMIWYYIIYPIQVRNRLSGKTPNPQGA